MALPRILVVDNEENVGARLSAALWLTGFKTEVAQSAAQCLRIAQAFRPDLVILDVLLRGTDGFRVAQRLRADHREVPIVFLSAASPAQDHVAGAMLGVNGYVANPSDLDEVVFRAQAILHRQPAPPVQERTLRYADLELDEVRHDVRRANRSIQLSPTEFRLLRYLMINADKAIARDEIVDRVWGGDFGGSRRIIESYVHYLRKKLDAVGPPLIHTIRGVGYALRRTTSIPGRTPDGDCDD
jgi:two-component system, OmpR family, response regulator